MKRFVEGEDSSIQRRGERATCVRMAEKRVRVGSSRKRIAPPAGFDEREQAGPNAAAEQFDKLSAGEIEKSARSRSRELVRQPPAEKSFDERVWPSERRLMGRADVFPVIWTRSSRGLGSNA